MPMLYVILIHIFKWGTNEDVHTACMFACIYIVQCVYTSKHTHSVYPCRFISTQNVISAHDCT